MRKRKGHRMSILGKLFRSQVLFQGFSDSEKRQLLEIDHTRLHGEKMRREGKVKVIDIDTTQDNIIKRISDKELAQLVRIRELTRKADSTSNIAAIHLYKQVLKLAPWDEISMMSIGVEYANARNFSKAIRWLEKAAKVNPSNARVKRNLDGVKAAARS
jgi:tetratricopeptide (TPR) repeat protein